ncbi:hypothetical protein LTR37_020428 [Vermiconidia calcicola]|uniref:Uncharacterized protein n=1 Tax=Vermiconidia calcicola TaxID=1690605 RepID=A0ACC3MB73_9PEZI|nr:hypothetical protein LTR37_020428 [Vermiconidia calcicola]
MIAFTFPPVIANLWFREILNPMETVGAVVHAAFFIATVVLLGVSGPRVPDSQVWNNLTVGTSGWTLPGVTFGLGLLPAAFSTAGMDGVLHMSKEVKNSRRNVPIAMTSAVIANSIIQWITMVVVCYRLGDPKIIAAAPGGTTIIAVYMQATNSKAVTTVFIVAQLITLFVSLFNIL